MPSDELKQLIQSNYSLLLKRKQLQTRGGQKRMIAEIVRTLAGSQAEGGEGEDEAHEPAICVLEAGTGTGKTLAYLLAALPTAKSLDKKLIIATATVALQEQVLYRDIPDLLGSTDLQFTFALAKGRGRYLCLARLDNALRSNASSDALRDLFRMEVQDPAQVDRQLYESMLEALGNGSWQGDRDDWPASITEEQWRPVAVEQGQCAGNRCSWFSSCCYFRSRDNLQKVDCIVANHDLVLSDLSLGGGVILPAPEDSIYVFDEAHQLPVKSLNHFAHSLRCLGTAQWLEQFAGVMQRIGQDLDQRGDLPNLLRDAREHCITTRAGLQEVSLLLVPWMERAASTGGQNDQSQYVFPRGVVDAGLCLALDALAVEFVALATRIGKIVDRLKQALEDEGGEIDRQQAETWYPLFGSALARTEAAAACCLQYSRRDGEGAAPQARWLVFSDGGGQVEVRLATSPVIAAEDLQEKLWSRCHGAVLTSATLTALGSFDFLIQRCGLPQHTACHRIGSPFQHGEAGVLQVPARGFDPVDQAAHSSAIAACLPTLLAGDKGALVLFSSRRQMNEVLQLLPPAWRRMVLSQDDYPKQELLRLHREAVDGGGQSVIFGLASLAEGIDLPGAWCSHVVIAKIPFPVPNDPVDATLGEWVKAQGRNPFRELALPEAALRLVQASGRLLRREEDRGTITILDERLLRRAYGRDILDSLPPYRRQVLQLS